MASGLATTNAMTIRNVAICLKLFEARRVHRLLRVPNMFKTIDPQDLENTIGGHGLAAFYQRGPWVTRWRHPGGNISVYANGRDVTNSPYSSTMR
jgi:hypothetical protein